MKKILVIEDEDNIRSFVVINLKRAGYDVLRPQAARRRSRCSSATATWC